MGRTSGIGRRWATVVVALAGSLALLGPTLAAPPTALSEVTVKAERRGYAINDAEYEALKGVAGKVPHYSPEQTASMICEAMANGRSTFQAQVAHVATERFEQVKRDVRAGKAPVTALVQAETQRQAAFGNLFTYTAASFNRLSYDGFVLQDIEYVFRKIGAQEVVVITGTAHNTRAKTGPVPPITVYAIDRFGLMLAGETYQATDNGKPMVVAANETRPFELIMDNRPQYAASAKAVLGPPFAYRDDRSCSVMTAYRPEYQPLYAAATDAEQRELNQLMAQGGGTFDIDGISARVVREAGVPVLEVSGVVHNLAADAKRVPPLTVFLVDEKGQKIGFTRTTLGAETLPAGGTKPFTERFDMLTRMPTVPDEDLLSMMKHVALVLG
jgi:hypothetical protein